MQKIDKVMNRTAEIMTNKQTRSVIFLILSLVAVLALNSLLPLLEGNAHYTHNAIDVTYGEYEQMYKSNDNYNLTYTSKANIALYKIDFIKDNPDLTTEEKYNIIIPESLQVSVYTKFFFESSTWYTSTLVQVLSVIFIYISLVNFLVTRHKSRYKKYIDLDDEVTTLINTQLDPITFEPYMHDVFNRNRKIMQHKYNIKYQLDKLERKLPYEVRTEMRLMHNNPAYAPSKRILKAIKKYTVKSDKLKRALTDEYIETYVIDGKVKDFKYVHPIFVLCGVNTVSKTHDSFSNIRTDASKFSKDLLSKVSLSIIFTVALAVLVTVTVVTSSDQPAIWVIVNILTKIVPLTLQIPLAYDYRDTFMDTQLIANLMLRRNIAYLYLAYKEQEATNANKNQS